jgi:hypothetical protein
MPPTDDVVAQVAAIMEPWNEEYRDEDGGRSHHGFWDFYVIGGRFAGAKIEDGIGEERLARFRALLVEREVTVSSVLFGKPELSPPSQIPDVDALWREHFPDSGVAVCPLFAHSNDQFNSGSLLPQDICTLALMPSGLTAERVMITGPDWEGERVTAHYMAQREFWNGVNHCPSAWDGSVASALAAYEERLASYKPEYRERQTPRPDWLVVTVDYHS